MRQSATYPIKISHLWKLRFQSSPLFTHFGVVINTMEPLEAKVIAFGFYFSNISAQEHSSSVLFEQNEMIKFDSY